MIIVQNFYRIKDDDLDFHMHFVSPIARVPCYTSALSKQALSNKPGASKSFFFPVFAGVKYWCVAVGGRCSFSKQWLSSDTTHGLAVMGEVQMQH